MEELGDCLNPSLYDSVLIALVKKNELRLALSIFFKLLEASDNHSDDTGEVIVSYVPGKVAVNELLVGLRRADMRLEFRRVFEKLKEVKKFKFDTWSYNICIHGFGCWGDLDAALSLFKEMKEQSSIFGSSFGPNICTYNSLIHVLCLFGKAKDALIEMQHNGFVPDTVLYNSLLDGTLEARKVTEACQLFEKMIQEGVRASCWTYNILIDGLFRNGRAEAGFNLFCDLKKKGKRS